MQIQTFCSSSSFYFSILLPASCDALSRQVGLLSSTPAYVRVLDILASTQHLAMLLLISLRPIVVKEVSLYFFQIFIVYAYMQQLYQRAYTLSLFFQLTVILSIQFTRGYNLTTQIVECYLYSSILNIFQLPKFDYTRVLLVDVAVDSALQSLQHQFIELINSRQVQINRRVATRLSSLIRSTISNRVGAQTPTICIVRRR